MTLRTFIKYIPRRSIQSRSCTPFLQILPVSSSSASYDDNIYSKSLLLGLLSLVTLGVHQTIDCQSNQNEITENGPGVQSNMPIISRAEVTRHKTVETRIWTTFKNGLDSLLDSSYF